MTLKEYIESLEKFAEENPETLEMTVVYSADDEGNSFNMVCYTPSKGHYDNEYNGGFTSDEEDIEENGYEINAVCVN